MRAITGMMVTAVMLFGAGDAFGQVPYVVSFWGPDFVVHSDGQPISVNDWIDVDESVHTVDIPFDGTAVLSYSFRMGSETLSSGQYRPRIGEVFAFQQTRMNSSKMTTYAGAWMTDVVAGETTVAIQAYRISGTPRIGGSVGPVMMTLTVYPHDGYAAAVSPVGLAVLGTLVIIGGGRVLRKRAASS